MCCENISAIFNISSMKMVGTVYSLGSSVEPQPENEMSGNGIEMERQQLHVTG